MPIPLRTLAAAVLLFPCAALAQTGNPDHPRPQLTPAERHTLPIVTHTFFLKNSDEVHVDNEISTAIRNTLDPETKIYLLPSENAVVVTGNEDQIELAGRLFQELDRPHKSFRLTYTLTTVENNKPVGTEHFSVVTISGQHISLKQGSKVPIATGSYEAKSDASQVQYTYIDIGMNFDVTLWAFSTGVRLQSRVEQSSIAPEQSGVGAADPTVRQVVLEGTSILTPGKPLLLGSLDISGTNRRVDIAVTMDPVS